MRAMKKTGVLLLFLIVLSAAGLSSTGQRPVERQTSGAASPPSLADQVVRELRAKIPEWLREKDVPGAAVAVVDGSQILWQEVYGATTRTKTRAVTARTLFSIQSMSKSFTALAVLLAVQDGLLDLDAPITAYLPDFKVHSRYEDALQEKMTLRHLLAHRAGFTHEAPLGGNFDRRPHSFEEHIRSISDTWLRYPVGYRYSYSNLGIDLAGYILEKKSGQPFWRCIRDRIFVPLGMTDSTLNFEEIDQAADRALGHLSPAVKVPEGIPVEVPMIPAGGVYTNIADMARYLQFFINNGRVGEKQVLRVGLLKEMETVAFPEKNQRYGYGLGLQVDEVGNTFLVQHGGGGYGFISFMAAYPELNFGVATLTNSAESRVDGARILEAVNAIVEKAQGPAVPVPKGPEAEGKTPLGNDDPRVMGLLGQYDNNVRIGFRDGALGLTLGRDFYPVVFYEEGDGVVGAFGQHSELRVKPPLPDQRGTLVLVNRLSGTSAAYDFFKPEASADRPGPDKPEWREYIGLYRMSSWSRSSGGFCKVAVVDGYLTLNGARCREHLPGLFFTPDGEALDLRGTVATFRNILLIRSK